MAKVLSRLKKLEARLPDNRDYVLQDGFDGDISAIDEFVTDGVVIFRRESVLKGAPKIKQLSGARVIDEKQLRSLWSASQSRIDAPLRYLGCVPSFFALGAIGKDAEPIGLSLAIFRDDNDCLYVADAERVSYLLLILGVDAAFAAATADPVHDPIAFYRDGRAVAYLMPMHWSFAYIEGWDVDGEAVPLDAVMKGLLKKASKGAGDEATA